MKKPNLFIIGAQKCGTTSLHSYLSAHPDIFMSRNKEPLYFSQDDLPLTCCVNSIQSYENLFVDAGPQHKIVGEASTLYLYSQEAVKNILVYSPDAKFIVMLRNPIDMSYSHHNQMLKENKTNVVDFETAWNQQDDLASSHASLLLPCPSLMQYGKMSKLGEQMERLYKLVSKERVFVILYDDFKANTKEVYEGVLNFLNLPLQENVEFRIHNEGKTIRSPVISRMIVSASVIRDWLGLLHI